MKGIYATPGNVRANRDVVKKPTDIDQALLYIEEYENTQEKDNLIKAIHYLSKLLM